jgi:hypothetical protein
VTEEKRFEEPLKKMESIAKNWARLKVGYYGKAIVVNTLMKAQLTYRAQVNAVSRKKKEEFKGKMRDFVWDKKQKLVAWHKLVRPIKQGGIGLVDIECALDVQKISILRNMMQRKGQPWANWLGRKERRVKERWGVEGDVYGHKAMLQEKKQLNEECMYEQMLKIWYEVGGTTRTGNMNRKTARVRKETKKREEEKERVRQKREEEQEARIEEERREEDRGRERGRRAAREAMQTHLAQNEQLTASDRQAAYEQAAIVDQERERGKREER